MMQLVAWLHVLVVAGGIAIFIYAVLKKDEKFVEITVKVLFVACLIVAVLEWNLGTDVALYVQEQGDIYGTGEITFVTAESSSYLYFVFLLIFEIAYFAAEKYLPDTFELKMFAKQKTAVDSADELLKYRELYESGIITEETYEKKKEEFLKDVEEK
ncbi:MAG: SHOCT domain-containing protein [Clostridia bacterium]|nr:SHOCT domain-containing protein [Clostridia bacterium]